jgi:hypothetical protein
MALGYLAAALANLKFIPVEPAAPFVGAAA